MTRTCGTCLFLGLGGRCHRYPPTPMRYPDEENEEPGAILETSVFPLTHKDNWCGEWRADKPEAP